MSDRDVEAHEANIRALQILQELGDRRAETEEHREILSRFAGWADSEVRRLAFDWRDRPTGLQGLVSPEEGREILAATAHAPICCPEAVGRSLWDAAAALLGALSSARVLDACTGGGQIAALAPSSVGVVAAYSPCPASARVAQALAPPEVKILQERPQDDAVPAGWFDAAVGASPAEVSHEEDACAGDSLVPPRISHAGVAHWYASRVALSLRPDGVAAIVVPTSWCASWTNDVAARAWLMRRCDVLGLFDVPDLADGRVLVFRRRADLRDEGSAAEMAEILVPVRASDLSDVVRAVAVVDAGRALARDPASPPATDRRRPRRRAGTLAEALALDAYRAARVAFDAQLDPGADGQVGALLARARDRLAKLVGQVGPLVVAEHDKNHALRGLVGSREWRLLSVLGDGGDRLLSGRSVRAQDSPPATKDPADWLAHHMDRYGFPYLSGIASACGLAADQIWESLGIAGADGSPPRIALDPETGRAVLARQLVAGAVGEKLSAARALVRLDSRYEASAAILQAAVDEADARVGVDIRVPLGAPWVPEEVVREFAAHLAGATDPRRIECSRVGHGGGWSVSTSAHSVEHSFDNAKKWGCRSDDGGGATALELLDAMLNLRAIEMWRQEETDEGTIKRVRDPRASLEARGKADEIREEWQRWLRVDAGRWSSLVSIYAERFGRFSRPEWSGDYLSFPGLAIEIGGRPFDPRTHQREVEEQLARESSPDDSFLVVHHVGYGKTASFLLSAVRRWHLGLTDRTIAVVPKNVLRQWRSAARDMFPTMQDDFLFAPEVFSGAARETFLAAVAAGDAAFVFLTYEQFAAIPPSMDALEKFSAGETDPLREAIADLPAGAGGESRRKSLQRLLSSRLRSASRVSERAQVRWAKLNKAANGAKVWCWEDVVGDPSRCTLLAGDEWQYLKRLPIHTRMTKISGLPSDESLRAMDALVKIRYVGDAGSKVGGLTGTPLTNSLAEAYVAMRFFQPRRLRQLGLEHFDDWASSFTEPVTSVEMDAVGQFRPVTRLRFVNVPELIGVLGEVWNFARRSDEVARPDLVGGEPIIVEVPGSPELRAYVLQLARRAEAIRAGEVDPSEDNMLKLTSDGRRAAMWNGEPSSVIFPLPPSATPDVCRCGHGHMVHWDRGLLAGGARDACFHTDGERRCSCAFYAGPRSTKLDACADKIWEVYARHHDDRGAQLVFLDLGTPRGETSEDMTDAERFQAEQLYGELRSRIVARGVLASQIAFVHQARNDAQRDEMFRAVNAGEIRVLVGSTDKLGVGTNPQRRCVAVHHLDCPWRPDQLIQRTGRGRRNGNLWDSLYEFVYVTTRSYDVCLWQLIQAKADFVSKLQEGVAVAREADDVGDLVLTSAMAKALALGDQRVVDKIKLETDLAHMERLHRAWEATRASARGDLDKLPARLEKLRADLAATEAAQDLRHRPERFSALLRDLADAEPAEVVDMIAANGRLYAIANALRPQLRRPLRVGSYRGRPISLLLRYGSPALQLEIAPGAVVEVLNIHSAGTFEQLDRELGMIEVRAKTLARTISQEEARDRALREELSRPWSQAGKALDKIVEYEILCETLKTSEGVDKRDFNFIGEEAVANRYAEDAAKLLKRVQDAETLAEATKTRAGVVEQKLREEIARIQEASSAVSSAADVAALKASLAAAERDEALTQLDVIRGQRRADAAAEVRATTERGSLLEIDGAGSAPEIKPMVMDCPHCGTPHVDEGEWATRPHHTHECQNDLCLLTWRVEPYVCGVRSRVDSLIEREERRVAGGVDRSES